MQSSAPGSRGGLYSRAKKTAYSATPPAMNGRRRPNRVRAWSESQPITGSVITSKDRARAVKKERNATWTPMLM